jgi:hypothetical protein
MANEGLLRSLFKEGVSQALFEGLKWLCLIGLPFVLTGITAVTGYLQGVPWTYIIVAASFVFAATATGLLRFDEWRFRRTARNKVTVETFALGFDYARDAANKPTAVERAQVSLIIKNDATFPIYYIVDEIASSVDGRVNQNPRFIKQSYYIGAKSTTHFRDDVIDMHALPIKSPLEGTIKCKLRYGAQGREKYPIELHWQLGTSIDPTSGTYGAGSWTTVTERI